MVASEGSLRVLIADDNPRLRAALRRDLETAGLDVCAEASTGPGAVTAALRERPDVCLIDVEMPGDGGTAAAASIRRSLPGTGIVMITATPHEEGMLAAARAGADGYLPKDVSPSRLPFIVRAVAAGETAFPRRMLRRLISEFRAAG